MSDNAYKLLQTALAASLERRGLADTQVRLERPANVEHGDWSSNVAMTLTKTLQKAPLLVAQELASELQEDADLKSVVAEVTTVAPGFLNFRLHTHYFAAALAAPFVANVGSELKDGKGEFLVQGANITIEYGQPNTHKLPHIGHLYSYIVGESLARFLEVASFKVRRANYQGDVGPHVAKCIYMWQKLGRPQPETLAEKIALLQKCYQEGSAAYDEDEVAKAEINRINKAIYQRDPEIMADWELTRGWCLENFRAFEAQLDVHQERQYLESEVWEDGMRLVKEHVGDVFIESQGALVFPGEKYGLHSRVFVTGQGTPTYEAKDLGLSLLKYKEQPYDLSIITTASEQTPYFTVVIKAIETVSPQLVGKLRHLGFGMVSLSTGKMASRTGKILSASDLLEVVTARVAEILATREGLSEAERQDIANKVSLGAIKYAFLRGNVLQNMKFDLEESVAFDGNSGPYLQYTYARMQSILRQVTEEASAELDGAKLAALLTHDSEVNLLRLLGRYHSTVSVAVTQLAPHLVATFAFQLAQAFNQFYKSQTVLNADDSELRAARIALSRRVSETLAASLSLLGIPLVEKM